MDDYLRDPAVGVAVAIIFGIAGLIASLVAIRVSHRRKSLSYGILPVTPVVTVADHEEARGNVQVTFNHILVTDIQLLRVYIANTGNVPISAGDFWQPLKIVLNASARILTASVPNSFPLRLGASISYNETQVEVPPLLLNNGDWFEVNILATKFDGNISVDGRISGVARIVELNANNLVLKTTKLPPLNTLLQFFSLISLIVFAYVISLIGLSLPISLTLLLLLSITSLLGLVAHDRKSSS